MNLARGSWLLLSTLSLLGCPGSGARSNPPIEARTIGTGPPTETAVIGPERPLYTRPGTGEATGAGTPGMRIGSGQGQPCQAGRCGENLTCVEYYGVAGPRGPRFSSCEVVCTSPQSPCPQGQSCTTIADGPGYVCR